MLPERRVPVEQFDPVEVAVMAPGKETLVIQGIRDESGIQDAGRTLADAVADSLEAVLDLQDAVLPVQDFRQFLLVVVALPLGLGQAGVPFVEGGLRDRRGIGLVERVDHRPGEAVARRTEGVDDDAVDQRVAGGPIPVEKEGIDGPEAVRNGHRVTDRDDGNRVQRPFIGDDQGIVVPDEDVLLLLLLRLGRLGLGLLLLVLPAPAALLPAGLARIGGRRHGGRIPRDRIYLQRSDVDPAEKVCRLAPAQGLRPRGFREHESRHGDGQQIFRPKIRHKPTIVQKYAISRSIPNRRPFRRP